MTSATIGRKSAASCLNRLQRAFDAASTRYRQTEALLAGGGSRTEAEAALHAVHTAAAFRAGTLQRKIELLGQRGRQQLAEPAGPPSQPKAAPSPAVSLGLTRPGAEVLVLLVEAAPTGHTSSCGHVHHAWSCRADRSPDDTPGQVRSGSDPPARPGP
jgi:hypothetical protein